MADGGPEDLDRPARGHGGEPPARAGWLLVLWAVLIVGLEGVLWVTGFRPAALAEGVERGSARVEALGIGEVGDDQVLKAIRLQGRTLPFWTALALLGDFLVAPLAPTARALAAAVLLSGLAALVGRPVGFGRALAGAAAVQGIWVLGLATRVGLDVALRRAGAETSPVLFLPPGTYPALMVVPLRQLDAFALLGWAALAAGAWRRGQANLLAALAICGTLFLVEATLRGSATLLIEAGMRMTLLP